MEAVAGGAARRRWHGQVAGRGVGRLLGVTKRSPLRAILQQSLQIAIPSIHITANCFLGNDL